MRAIYSRASQIAMQIKSTDKNTKKVKKTGLVVSHSIHPFAIPLVLHKVTGSLCRKFGNANQPTAHVFGLAE